MYFHFFWSHHFSSSFFAPTTNRHQQQNSPEELKPVQTSVKIPTSIWERRNVPTAAAQTEDVVLTGRDRKEEQQPPCRTLSQLQQVDD